MAAAPGADAPPPMFRTPLSAPLLQSAFRGAEAIVLLRDDRLEFHDEARHFGMLPLSEVARVRVAVHESKGGRSWSARVWPMHGPEPLLFTPSGDTRAGYTALLRALAAALAARGRLARVERGTSVADALVAPVLFGLLAGATLGVALFVLADQPWWGRLLVPVLPLALFAIVLRHARRTDWPAPLADLRELDRFLPPLPGEVPTPDHARWYLLGGRPPS